MTPRQLAIVAAAGIAAFAVALGVSSAGGKEKASSTGEPAEVLEVSAATVKAGAPDAAKLPSLVVPKPKPKPKPQDDTSSSTSSSSSSTGTVSPPVTEAPETQAPATQAPSTTTTSPPATTTSPSTSTGGGGTTTTQGPISTGGGED